MKPGIYRDISNADYHSGPGISNSGLSIIARSPLHFDAAAKSRAANDNQPTSTPAQIIGSAFHCLVLEPQLFYQQYTLSLRPQDVPDAVESRDVLVTMVQELNADRKPKLSTSGTKDELIARIAEDDYDAVDLNILKSSELKAIIERLNESREGLFSTSGTMQELAHTINAAGGNVKLWKDVQAEWLENNSQRTVLTQEQFDKLCGMRDAVMAHPAARALLTAPGEAEKSVYWNDPITGELCRCRPDFWRDDGVIVDLKSTDDASADGFSKSIAQWRYHVQAPFYVDGVNHAINQTKDADHIEAKAFAFVVCEKNAPYAVAVYVLDDASMEIGRAEYRRDLNKYADCIQKNVWPGYGDKVQSISLPAWHINKNAALISSAA